MLLQRIITALILAPLLILAIFKLSNSQLAIVLAAITLVGAWEWSNLIELSHTIKKIVYVGLIGITIFIFWKYAQGKYANVIYFVASLWWLLVLLMLAFYKSSWLHSTLLPKILMISVFIVLIPAWLALVKLHNFGISMLMFFLVIIWVADIAAYFVGKKFGKHKLAPELSPGKSREGVLGALLASLAVALVGTQIFSINKQVWFFFICLCVLTALISVVGDLYESLLKRKAGVKDSGKILPGHGGVLDRIDSITAAAPVYVLGLHWVV